MLKCQQLEGFVMQQDCFKESIKAVKSLVKCRCSQPHAVLYSHQLFTVLTNTPPFCYVLCPHSFAPVLSTGRISRAHFGHFFASGTLGLKKMSCESAAGSVQSLRPLSPLLESCTSLCLLFLTFQKTALFFF